MKSLSYDNISFIFALFHHLAKNTGPDTMQGNIYLKTDKYSDLIDFKEMKCWIIQQHKAKKICDTFHSN